jgi:hypothetical protein
MFEATAAIHIERNKECFRGDHAPRSAIPFSLTEAASSLCKTALRFFGGACLQACSVDIRVDVAFSVQETPIRVTRRLGPKARCVSVGATRVAET